MPQRRREALVVPVAIIVSIVWSAVAIAAILTNQYQPLVIVTPVMLMVCGFVFGVRVRAERNGRNGRDT